jgi:hypothetical protein
MNFELPVNMQAKRTGQEEQRSLLALTGVHLSLVCDQKSIDRPLSAHGRSEHMPPQFYRSCSVQPFFYPFE